MPHIASCRSSSLSAFSQLTPTPTNLKVLLPPGERSHILAHPPDYSSAILTLNAKPLNPKPLRPATTWRTPTPPPTRRTTPAACAASQTMAGSSPSPPCARAATPTASWRSCEPPPGPCARVSLQADRHKGRQLFFIYLLGFTRSGTTDRTQRGPSAEVVCVHVANWKLDSCCRRSCEHRDVLSAFEAIYLPKGVYCDVRLEPIEVLQPD